MVQSVVAPIPTPPPAEASWPWAPTVGEIPGAHRPSEACTRVQVAVLLEAGRLACRQGDLARAVAALQEGMTLARALGDDLSTALLHAELAEALLWQNELEAATPLFAAGAARARAHNDQASLTRAVSGLALTAWARGDLDQAHAALTELQGLARHPGNLADRTETLPFLGLLFVSRGQHARAVAWCEEGLAACRARGDSRGEGLTRILLGTITTMQDEPTVAARWHREGLRSFGHQRDDWRLTWSLDGVACLAAATDQIEPAARLFGTATATLAALGSARWPMRRAAIEPSLARIRAHLGHTGFMAAHAAGQLLSLPAAVDEALAVIATVETGGAPRPRPVAAQVAARPPTEPLTRREREVLGYLVKGATDGGIAQALGIGVRTVHTHVANILSKTGVANRAAAAALAVSQGLI